MAKLPRSAPRLDLPAETTTLPAGTLLWRVYRRGGPYRTTWNRFRTVGPLPSARFDHHPYLASADRRPGGPAVLYASEVGPACLAEAFQANRTIMRRYRSPYLVAFALVRPVTVLDACGLWPTAAGASQAIASGPRSSSRVWAQAIRAAYPQLEGIRYRSSMYGGEPVVVLNESAAAALPKRPEDDIPLADLTMTAYVEKVAQALAYRVSR